MAEIKLKEHESIDSALKRFKRRCEISGLVSEIKKREFYEKPSEKRKRALHKRKKRKRRQMLREQSQ
ncbi:MAG: 30S ribosomal protein S21 [bacterium]|nr:30S ribosomal protein S21 [bacterium]